jgi:cell division protein FtsN
MEDDSRRPQTMALAPVLIFAAVLVAVFGAAVVTTLDHKPAAVVAGDSAPPGTTGLARPHAKPEAR